ncbi:SDR family oxidoreductase [Roseobacter sp. OBYS 0001]|uniref:SDR family oxidoreductase n=1 Tax=Roseobacter sp. OBYS 0001 TaxID=882651 RepID=UPI001BBF4A19|nr:SDR family oxidoreductase [Roseobacter sp. OBYS 0001]GIT89479.1 oxidoreductase [Roseobacter sp. OBYS 0001]
MTDNAHSLGRLAGKKAVITGGTTGIGFSAAQSYLAEGAQVIITGRKQENVDAAVAKLGQGAYGIAADSSSLSDLKKLAEAAKTQFGNVDILFANAGNGIFAPVADVDEELYARQFDLNVKGVFFTVQSLVPLMTRGGSIILTASAVHGKGAPGGSLYFASKAAVRSFARSMAAEFGSMGIRVNTLSPGIVPTQFFENSNAPAALYNDFEAMAGHGSPMGRAGTPEEQAAVAVFLASDESRFMTAADLVNDGGWMNV